MKDNFTTLGAVRYTNKSGKAEENVENIYLESSLISPSALGIINYI